ncbi:MAG: hypothetical protein HOP12_15065 [Candidatus Eisenbacteria bacterium]|uniref:6-bladed beta-propeller n=1 Tax=Eiseniibacteriota bacterium TaxID=2212470 RepID=A0A849SS29_UNCEI|nr:hypothetical protein [Candidatus Eisenbacteria bacterium]
MFVSKWGSAGSGNGQFNQPHGLATDAAGNVFVADNQNQRMQRFGAPPTETHASSWGQIKSRFR